MNDFVAIQGDYQVNGVRGIALESDFLRVSVLPEIGGKIYELTWKPGNWDVLWKNPRVAPQPYPVEAALGDMWCGGWDDIFPTCDACEFGGLRYPALGELHQSRFSVEDAWVKNGEASARLSAYTAISPVQVHKTITVAGSVLRVHNELTNLGPTSVDFIWGTHPAFRPKPGMILRIPAKTGIVAQSSGPKFGAVGQRYDWPKLTTHNQITDMSRICGMDAKGFCGHYATDLQEGWYALEDPDSGQGVVVSFPLEVCPFIWLWLGYGGWRGHWVLIVEPYTSYPVNLTDAVRQNTHHCLEVGQTFSIDIVVSFYKDPATLADTLARVR